MPVDAGVVIQGDVSKHLKWRRRLQTTAAGSSGAAAGQETVCVHVCTHMGQDAALSQITLTEAATTAAGAGGFQLQQRLCISRVEKTSGEANVSLSHGPACAGSGSEPVQGSPRVTSKSGGPRAKSWWALPDRRREAF